MRSFGLLVMTSAAILAVSSGFSCSESEGFYFQLHGLVLCCATEDCGGNQFNIAAVDNYCDVTDTVPCIVEGYAECAGNTDHHYWIGDGWCDVSNNNEACGWDHGDCCPESCCGDMEYTCGIDGPGYDCYDPSPEFTACGDGVDAREKTTVTQTSSAYDTRDESDGGCDPVGCTPALTRDQNADDGSRWSCSEQLRNATCTITYHFEAAQDIGRLKINFYKGEEDVRSLSLTDDTGFEAIITSSGTTSGWESFDIYTEHTSSLTMEALDLDSADEIGITEVEFIVD